MKTTTGTTSSTTVNGIMFEDIHVEYIDHMGDDLRVANAARVSMGKWKEELDERDKRLLHYLSDNNHWTPFGHGTITLRETVPIFVARQRFKHTVGFVYNETSRRYVDTEPTFYKPDAWRARAENVKQGSGEDLQKDWLFKDYKTVVQFCNDFYNHFLAAGMAPEQARMILPQSMMTTYIVTGSLYAWANAFRLRSDAHAQKEIQGLAELWGKVISPLFPVSWNALTGTEGKELTNA